MELDLIRQFPYDILVIIQKYHEDIYIANAVTVATRHHKRIKLLNNQITATRENLRSISYSLQVDLWQCCDSIEEMINTTMLDDSIKIPLPFFHFKKISGITNGEALAKPYFQSAYDKILKLNEKDIMIFVGFDVLGYDGMETHLKRISVQSMQSPNNPTKEYIFVCNKKDVNQIWLNLFYSDVHWHKLCQGNYFSQGRNTCEDIDQAKRAFLKKGFPKLTQCQSEWLKTQYQKLNSFAQILGVDAMTLYRNTISYRYIRPSLNQNG